MINRRKLLKTGAAAGFAVSAGGLAMPALAQGTRVKIGYVSPQSGPLAGFAESDAFALEMFKRVAAEKGMDVEVLVKDSQSNPNRAADVAQELIIDDGVHLMLVASTPETTNPVTTVCENEFIPCISTMAPWQPWFIGQQGNPGDPASWRPFDYAFHYFWGLEDVIAVFTNMWDQLDTNKKVAGLFPNDADGNAWGDPQNGVAPGFAADGYETVDPGRYQNLTDDFSAQINAFKQADCEIVTGVVIPPDFTTFRNQALQQGFSPKAITVAKAILFPQSVETLGESGHNLSSEVWWSKNHPFTSSLTGQGCEALAADFTKATGRPWTQPIGYIHSLFEMAADVIQRAEDPTDPDLMAETIAATDLQTIVGRIVFNGEGLPPFAATNVCKTPLVGGQWRRQDDGSFELLVVDNKTAPDIPTQGSMEPLS
ncbi:ABC transporter substrate-binding protein [Pseudooceanicola sp. 216_PA32_1]|uniref:ABC transporter substrate-binding protein n=1 Tax=Pseudooceanicola pacificus TaxID=2676438 RepID=A0A844W481_9RHOB|nr:ABC transporter substrate-binding protein [Pseudooceanicola pacificus]MWB79026.1 ABC transporter substrate-binding protein [Pseudooceanicola pacificus]